MDRKNKPAASAGTAGSEPEKKASEHSPRISYIVSGICALAVAAAAGAAVVADKAFKDESGARIYNSSSYTAENTSSYGADSSSSAAESASSESRDDSSAVRKTRVTTTAKVYEYPQDINTAELDCFLAVSGINRTVAEGVVAYRERMGAIHNYEELLEIYGIGERSLSVIKEHFFISEDKQVAYTTAAVTTRAHKVTEKKTASKKTQPAVTEVTTVTVTSAAAVSAAVTTDGEGMRPVNINKAGVDEIADSLKLTPEQAEEIVILRSRIGRFSDMLELLYAEGMTKQAVRERAEYILLDDPQEMN